jgi:two-component system chemotaxis response regulator CheB
MIRVLVVEDSLVVRGLLVHILRSDPEIQVIGTAGDGNEALQFLAAQKPDVVTMDIHLPRMDGLEATRRIMETQPVPIVIVSANWNPEEVATTFRAMEAGAVALVEKPRGPGHPEHTAMAAKLVQTVKAMAEVRVIRRWARARPAEAAPAPPPPPPIVQAPAPIQIVAIGASTGGPPVLHTILAALPPDFPVPLLIVQHIAAGFVGGLAQWLAQSAGRGIHVAAAGQQPLPGNAYLAPDGAHMGIDRGGRITLSQSDPENGLRPAVNYLFRSVIDALGARAAGVLLTGMGRDGAEELKRMKDRGAITIAQDKASSVVHGMPGEAIKLDGATYVLPPDKIAATLALLVKKP